MGAGAGYSRRRFGCRRGDAQLHRAIAARSAWLCNWLRFGTVARFAAATQMCNDLNARKCLDATNQIEAGTLDRQRRFAMWLFDDLERAGVKHSERDVDLVARQRSR